MFNEKKFVIVNPFFKYSLSKKGMQNHPSPPIHSKFQSYHIRISIFWKENLKKLQIFEKSTFYEFFFSVKLAWNDSSAKQQLYYIVASGFITYGKSYDIG
jgi:hypothetical protein